VREFTVTEIGVATTSLHRRRDAPCQPQVQGGVQGYVDVHESFQPALQDLEGFDRIWLLYIFDRNQGYRLTVQPPRGPRGHKRGLFATRAPHRPSPIGMTCARLLTIEDNRLYLADLDLLDRTPVIDIKPYIPMTDSFFGVRTGWVQEIEAGEEPSK
jgi:tRNA-Thr(GGU) m(6)t(6)A37 methyltransferase TsaA